MDLQKAAVAAAEAANEIERLRQKNEKLEEQNSMLNQMVINLIGKEVAHVKVHKPKKTKGE
jgi:transposase-like protein